MECVTAYRDHIILCEFAYALTDINNTRLVSQGFATGQQQGLDGCHSIGAAGYRRLYP